MTAEATPREVGSHAGLGLAPERATCECCAFMHAATREAQEYASRYADEVLELRAQVANLREALRWYAEGSHFMMAVQDAWDTVSGEPQNWWCDEAGTAMVEDGRHAKLVLAGELTGAQLHAPED